ncbi:MAG TPA: peptidoglycan-binding protein [Cellulomonas sp.]|nr:peptidoglycan-binding protein [Cellulomonas sp.]
MNTTKVGGGHWLSTAAAASYQRMRAAGLPAGITSAGRTHDEQQHLYELYKAGKGAFALRPGSSKHELGLALDLPDEGGNPRAWVRANGRRFGWVKDVNPREDWHMEYVAAKDEKDPAPVLRLGSRGSRVKKLQAKVGVEADGIFGPITKAAVKAWQKAHGLEADGIVGPITGRALGL